MSTLPAETTPTEVEHAWMESEPPGLFPGNQDSYWGQFRKVITDKLQEIADAAAVYYLNQSAKTVDESDMPEWEAMMDVPVQTAASQSLEGRRAKVLSRLAYGPFTRTNRRLIVESFIVATFGPAVQIGPDGIPIGSGIQLYSGVFSFTGTYNIVENVGAFSYDVRILNTITVDAVALTRELTRITPAGISFTITYTATP